MNTPQKIWLIGASEGIGRALANTLAEEGHQLAISARDAARLENLVDELPGSGHMSLPLNVCQNDAVLEAWKKLDHTWGGIDLLIYCAGYYKPLNTDTMTLKEMEFMLDVNLRGAMRVICAILPYFRLRNSGHIALIGSLAGYRGLPNSMGYGLSKAAIIHLAENLKCDLSSTNITVQVINPGFVKTRLTDLNTFKMPFLISPEEAAQHIIKTLRKRTFESHFPFIFGLIMKVLASLPYRVYFFLMKGVKNNTNDYN